MEYVFGVYYMVYNFTRLCRSKIHKGLSLKNMYIIIISSVFVCLMLKNLDVSDVFIYPFSV